MRLDDSAVLSKYQVVKVKLKAVNAFIHAEKNNVFLTKLSCVSVNKLCIDDSWNISIYTYIDGLSDFQRFSLPAVNQEICHGFIVDLHVRYPEKELFLWKL